MATVYHNNIRNVKNKVITNTRAICFLIFYRLIGRDRLPFYICEKENML